jgi:hypothetical protein
VALNVRRFGAEEVRAVVNLLTADKRQEVADALLDHVRAEVRRVLSGPARRHSQNSWTATRSSPRPGATFAR